MEREESLDQLATILCERGCFRVPNMARRKESARRARKTKKQTYKKGWEVRFVADSAAEARLIESLIRKAGFEPSAPYGKHGQIIVPLYGRDVTRMLRQAVAQIAA